MLSNCRKKDCQIHRTFRSMKWSIDGCMKNQHSYVPCNHEGPCDKSCDCFNTNNICTKYCGCWSRADRCAIQFPGCRCSAGNCRTKQCPCYRASWECDPDNCKSCHCGESPHRRLSAGDHDLERILAPEDEEGDSSKLRCKNVVFQVCAT